MAASTTQTFEKLVSGKQVTSHKGRFIWVEKTESGDWLAETCRREETDIKGHFRYTPETNCFSHYYDHAKTRKAAVEMVIVLIDDE